MSFAPLRIGVLSAANIARAFTAACKTSTIVDVAAVASRGLDKAEAFARETGIARALGSYEALLADAEIEAVYIPLPNSMHAEWAIKAVQAGKHVLCEKPLAMDAAQARAMFAAAEAHGVYLREGYPWMSQWHAQETRRWIAEGQIGKLALIRSTFGVYFADPANIRLKSDMGGGALYDAGSYATSLLRLAAGRCPTRVQATWQVDANGVDLTTLANIEFDDGLMAQIACSFATAFHRNAQIVGDKGCIETNYLNHPPMGAPPVLSIRRSAVQTDPVENVPVPSGNGFLLEAESFARLVREGEAAWNGASPQESIDIAMTLDAIRASAPTGQWVNVGS